MKASIFLVVGISIAVAIGACKKDSVPTPITNPTDCVDTVSFAAKINPIIQNHCIGCHNQGNGTGITLDNHANISANATAVVKSMRGETQLMPQGGPALPDSVIKNFDCWIFQGKLNN